MNPKSKNSIVIPILFVVLFGVMLTAFLIWMAPPQILEDCIRHLSLIRINAYETIASSLFWFVEGQGNGS